MPVKKHISMLAALGASALLTLTGCSSDQPEEQTEAWSPENPFPSTYQVPDSPPLLVRSASVYNGTGEQLEGVDVLVQDGKFVAIGEDLDAPRGATVIDAEGKWLTPGLIDVHSHMGVYPSPATDNHADGNEMTAPVTAQVWAEHSIWPQDPQWEKALAGGVTTALILPGSGNLIGGRGVTVKNIRSTTVQGMKFPGAPYSLKMACGENPKRVYGERNQLPSTRMGNMAAFRQAWAEAAEYKIEWDTYHAALESGDNSAEAPERDLKLDTLMEVLNGNIRIHNHCYRADEMAQMMDMAREFDYKITAFHHAIEAYKLAPQLADADICAVVWADWWGFKQEAFDMVRENLALLEKAGACAIIHSDDAFQVQRLNQEVAKAYSAARRMGMDMTRGEAMRWLTLNAATSLGLADQIGSIEAGKNADLVLWTEDPFSVYALAEKVWIDGTLTYDLNNPSVAGTSDFNIGIINPEENRP
ncbi:amidohydrolase [Halioglobus sp. HI00S01]|nr:amidohydrolase [Halioglobus sp. HI00S01]